MLKFEYNIPGKPVGSAKRTGQYARTNAHQLAGCRFEQLILGGTLGLFDPGTLQQFQQWLHSTSGCITWGGQRNTEPVGEIKVVYSPAQEWAEVKIEAVLKCREDFVRLAQTVERELREHDAFPQWRTSPVIQLQGIEPQPGQVVSVRDPQDVEFAKRSERVRQALQDGVITANQAAQDVQDFSPAFNPSTSPLVQHAIRELARLPIGEDEQYMEVIKRDVIELVTLVASQRHSGGTLGEVLDLFDRLVYRRENLTPLTDDPAEWEDMFTLMGGISNAEHPMRWQNVRNSSAFSGDGGKTYWTLSDKHQGERPPRTRPSEHVEPTGPHPVHP